MKMTAEDMGAQITAYVRAKRGEPLTLDDIDAAIPVAPGTASEFLSLGRIITMPPDQFAVPPFKIEDAGADIPEGVRKAISDLLDLARKGTMTQEAVSDLTRFVNEIKVGGATSGDAKVGAWVLRQVAGIVSEVVRSDNVRSPAFTSAAALDRLSAALA